MSQKAELPPLISFAERSALTLGDLNERLAATMRTPERVELQAFLQSLVDDTLWHSWLKGSEDHQRLVGRVFSHQNPVEQERLRPALMHLFKEIGSPVTFRPLPSLFALANRASAATSVDQEVLPLVDRTRAIVTRRVAEEHNRSLPPHIQLSEKEGELCLELAHEGANSLETVRALRGQLASEGYSIKHLQTHRQPTPALVEVLNELVSVDMSFTNGFRLNGLLELLREGRFPALRSLNLSHDRIYAEGGWLPLAQAIRGGSLRRLLCLNLESTEAGPDAIRVLAEGIQAGALPELQRLNLSRSEMGEEGRRALFDAIRSGNLDGLTDLELGGEMGPEEAQELLSLIRGGRLPKLQSLRLPYCGLRTEGVHLLAQILREGHLKELKLLDLTGNKIDSEGLVALTEVIREGCLEGLEALVLRGISVDLTDGFNPLIAIMREGRLGRLHTLDLGSNQISFQAQSQLVYAIREGCLCGIRRLRVTLLSCASKRPIPGNKPRRRGRVGTSLHDILPTLGALQVREASEEGFSWDLTRCQKPQDRV